MDFTIGKKIDPILERLFKKEIDLLEVRKELVILFNREFEQKLLKHNVSGQLVCECGPKPKDVPNDGYEYICNKCRKPFAN